MQFDNQIGEQSYENDARARDESREENQRMDTESLSKDD